MGENAEFYVYKENERVKIINWLVNHNVKFSEDMSTEELIEIYRRKECGEWI